MNTLHCVRDKPERMTQPTHTQKEITDNGGDYGHFKTYTVQSNVYGF